MSSPSDPETHDGEHLRWRKIEAIFEQSLAVPQAERAALLDELCGDDAALRREVEELLAADSLTGGLLDGGNTSRRELIVRAAEQHAEASSSLDESLPSQVGPYAIVGVLGQGGMGVVLLGEDRQLGRRVAIKTLPVHLEQDRDAAQRLAREARILASLGHPNIATIYGLVEEEGRRYLVLEYVAGESLGARLSRGALGLVETLRLLSQVAAGLEAAHGQGIVHRDLKPDNVLITAQDEVKIVDFGIAKSSAHERDPTSSWDSSLTSSGVVIGTVNYMSPEQAEGRAIDSRTDVWAFGCVLWESLVGRRVFHGATAHDTLEAVLGRHPAWDQLPPNLPSELITLIRRCLRKDPRERLRDIGDARLDLDELLDRHNRGDLPSELASPRRRRRSLLAGIALALALTVVGISAYQLGHWRAEEDLRDLNLAVPLDAALSERPGSMAIEPDGHAIVYCTPDGLLRRELASSSSHVLFKHPKVHSLFFSPDGSRVGAMVNNRLVTSPAGTGAPVTITTMSGPGVGASWGDDGRIVYAPDWSSGLWRIDAEGGQPKPVTHLLAKRGEVSHRFPHVLPGSRAVLYTVKNGEISSFEDAEIAVVDLDTGEQRTLLEGALQAGYFEGYLLYYRSGSLYGVAFDLEGLEIGGSPERIVSGIARDPDTGFVPWSVSARGDLLYQSGEIANTGVELSLFDVNGRVDLDIPDLGGSITGARFSPDGQRLVISVVAANNALWLHDLVRGTQDRIAWGRGNVQNPIWTPDGQWITFVRRRGAHEEILETRADMSGEMRGVWRGEQRHLPMSWSPDGQFLLTELRLDGGDSDIWVIRRGGEARPLLSSSAQERSAEFSSDGSSFFYTSDESGSVQLYAQPFPELGHKRRVSHSRASHGLWFTEGPWIYFGDPSPTGSLTIFRVQATDARFDAPEALVELPEEFRLRDVSGGRILAARATARTRVDHLRLKFGALDQLGRSAGRGD